MPSCLHYCEAVRHGCCCESRICCECGIRILMHLVMSRGDSRMQEQSSVFGFGKAQQDAQSLRKQSGGIYKAPVSPGCSSALSCLAKLLRCFCGVQAAQPRLMRLLALLAQHKATKREHCWQLVLVAHAAMQACSTASRPCQPTHSQRLQQAAPTLQPVHH